MTRHRCDPPLAERPVWTCPDCNTRWRYIGSPPWRPADNVWRRTIVQPRPWFPAGWWR